MVGTGSRPAGPMAGSQLLYPVPRREVPIIVPRSPYELDRRFYTDELSRVGSSTHNRSLHRRAPADPDFSSPMANPVRHISMGPSEEEKLYENYMANISREMIEAIERTNSASLDPPVVGPLTYPVRHISMGPSEEEKLYENYMANISREMIEAIERTNSASLDPPVIRIGPLTHSASSSEELHRNYMRNGVNALLDAFNLEKRIIGK